MTEKEAAQGCIIGHQGIIDHIHQWAMKDFHSSYEIVLIVRSQVNASLQRWRQAMVVVQTSHW
jgi:hypothetical protein